VNIPKLGMPPSVELEILNIEMYGKIEALRQWGWRNKEGLHALGTLDPAYVRNIVRFLGRNKSPEIAAAFRNIFLNPSEKAIFDYREVAGKESNVYPMFERGGDWKIPR
jgi:hypothetical protein